MKRFFLILLTAMVLVTGLFAAGTQEPTDSERKLTVGVVVKALSDDHWLMVRTGARAAAKDLGVNLEFLGPNAETDIMAQTSMIEDLIAKKVDALVVAPSQPKAAVSIFNKAHAQGIPVLLIDTDAPFEHKATFIGTGNYNGGKLAGEYIVNKVGSGKKAVIIRGALGDLTHDERVAGAKDAMEAGGIDIVEIQAADSDRSRALNIMENILQNHGDVDVVFGTNDPMTLGALRCVMQAGKADQIMCIGFDGAPNAVKEIKAGNLQGSVAQSPFKIGYYGVENAVKLLNGEEILKRIDTGTIMIDSTNVQEIEKKTAELLGK